MTELRARLADALRQHWIRAAPGRACRCGSTEAQSYHLADVLLSLPGIAIVDTEEIAKKLRYNSHDLGEFGMFIRLEYALNILAAASVAGKETHD